MSIAATEMILSKGLPFAVWRMPGSKTVDYVVQEHTGVMEQSPERIGNMQGFIVAPFDWGNAGTMFVIMPDILFSSGEWETVKEDIERFPDRIFHFSEPNRVTTHDEYTGQAKFLINEMKKGAAKKVVLSRYIDYQLPFKLSPAYFFEALRKAYPDAFVSMFYLPGKGLWVTASPETFLGVENGSLVTMALAGTKPLEDKRQWTAKEEEEHQIVVDFVKEQLKKAGVSHFETVPREEVKAGRVLHLRTRFVVKDKLTQKQLSTLVTFLHPTPATGGLPKNRALNLIRQTELHDRRFYTGFLGPWNISGCKHLFVNLRCAEITDSGLGIYVGGGLTQASEPEAEWDETVIKSKTLLSVAKKLRTFAP